MDVKTQVITFSSITGFSGFPHFQEGTKGGNFKVTGFSGFPHFQGGTKGGNLITFPIIVKIISC